MLTWFKAREDLEEILSSAGPHIFFFTFLSADMHWPELNALFKSDGSNTPENRCQNIMNYPHITDWFFTQHLENFIKYFIQNTDKVEQRHKLSFDLNLASQVLNISKSSLTWPLQQKHIQAAILQKQKSIVVTFDLFNYKVTDITLA